MDNWISTHTSRRSSRLSLGSQHQLFSTGVGLHRKERQKELNTVKKKTIESAKKSTQSTTETEAPQEAAPPVLTSPATAPEASSAVTNTQTATRVSLKLPGQEPSPSPATSPTESPSPPTSTKKETTVKRGLEPEVEASTSESTKRVKFNKAVTKDGKGKESQDGVAQDEEGNDTSTPQDAAKGQKQGKAKRSEVRRKDGHVPTGVPATTHQKGTTSKPKRKGKVSYLAK